MGVWFLNGICLCQSTHVMYETLLFVHQSSDISTSVRTMRYWYVSIINENSQFRRLDPCMMSPICVNSFGHLFSSIPRFQVAHKYTYLLGCSQFAWKLICNSFITEAWQVWTLPFCEQICVRTNLVVLNTSVHILVATNRFHSRKCWLTVTFIFQKMSS